MPEEEKYLWLHTDDQFPSDENLEIIGEEDDDDESIVMPVYGKSKEDCCCPPECPCYPLDGDAKAEEPVPRFPKQDLPNLELTPVPGENPLGDIDPPDYKEAYEPELMHPKAAQFKGGGHLKCPEAAEEGDDACGEDPCGKTGDPPTTEGCCGKPACIDESAFNEVPPEGQDAVLTHHSDCFNLIGNLRVWFWAMAYWDVPQEQYLGISPIDDDGMYETKPPGPVGDPKDVWMEGMVTVSEATHSANSTDDTLAFNQDGTWGWFYRNLGPAIGGGGSAPGGEVSFIIGGGSTPQVVKMVKCKPLCWCFYHMDCYYDEDMAKEGKPAKFILNQGRTEDCTDNGEAALMPEQKFSKNVGFSEAYEEEPTSGQMFVGWNPAYPIKGKLGYGGYLLTSNDPTDPDVWSDGGDPKPENCFNPDGYDPDGDCPEGPFMGGWLISNVGFHKSSSQGEGEDADPRPDLTAEKLFDEGKGVPCEGPPEPE